MEVLWKVLKVIKLRGAHGAFLLPGANGLRSLLQIASVILGDVKVVEPELSAPFYCETIKAAIQSAAVDTIRGKTVKCAVHIKVDEATSAHCLELLNIFFCSRQEEALFMTQSFRQTLSAAYLSANPTASPAEAFSRALALLDSNLHFIFEFRTISDLRLLNMNFPKMMDSLIVTVVPQISPAKDLEACLQSELMAGTAQFVSPEMARTGYQAVAEYFAKDFACDSAEKFFQYLGSIALFHRRLVEPRRK